MTPRGPERTANAPPGNSRCKVCSHPDVEAIDAAIIGSVSRRTIAERFGIHASSIQRHKDAHLGPALVKATKSNPDRSATLLDRIEKLVGRVETLVDTAEAEGKSGLMLSGVREMRALLELLGKATGELKPDGTSITVNIATSEEWLRIRGAVVQAVGPYPEARDAIGQALLELEEAS